ncbi:MAG TPA: Trp biosynthesis-associated membrane protein [Nocardioides sp.]
MAEPTRARRTFGPVVLLGLASAGLAAVAASKAWVAGESSAAVATGAMAFGGGDQGESPLALALALVLLATWGVVLVTRGRFRLVVAVLGAAAALGYAVTTAAAPWQLRDSLARAILEATGAADEDISVTRWWWAAVVASVLACVASAACVTWVRRWPEMGTKYDNPAGAGAAEDAGDAPVPTENIDIWKALDEGRDPTA